MADSFTFELVSPEKLLLSGDAEIVTVPGLEGDMGVMSNHAPVMTSLRPGVVSVKLGDGADSTFVVRGGFADITPEAVTILAEYAIAKDDLSGDVLEEQKRLAKEEYDKFDAAGDASKAANAKVFMEQLDHIWSVSRFDKNGTTR